MPAESLTATQIRRRYFVLLALRWMPVGILIPSLVLLAAERGVSVGDIGLALSLRGFIWLFMDLPAGSLADTWGRRSVLVSGGAVNLGSFVILATVPSLTGLMLYAVLQGIYRGLDNGALTSWFVDATQALPGDEPIDRGLRVGGAILGYAIAAGCLVCGALILVAPFPGVEPLNGPVIVGAFLAAASLIGYWVLMPRTKTGSGGMTLRAAVAGTPRNIRETLGLIRLSGVLRILVYVELLWGFGMVSYESLIPLRLEEVSTADLAATLLSPASAVGWFVTGIGAAALPFTRRLLGDAGAAAAFRVLQGLVVVGMGLAAGPVGVIAAYIACYVVHGAAAPLHDILLHHAVDGEHRTAAASVNSTANQLCNAIGLVILTWVANGFTVGASFAVAGVAMAAAAPLYLRLRRSRYQPDISAASTAGE